MATRSAGAKTKFGIAKTILLITLLIVLAQILAVSYLSSDDLFNQRNRRFHALIHEKDFVYEDKGTSNVTEMYDKNHDNNDGNIDFKRYIFNYHHKFLKADKDIITQTTNNRQV